VAPTRVRRVLTSEELLRLIQTTHDASELRGISGPLRALVYRLVAETGLRANEVQSLRAGDFDLSPTAATVTIRAANSKNRREATLPLRARIAADLEPFLRGRMPLAAAFPLPRSFKDKTSRWLKSDLEAAGIAYMDASDRVFDFHALRAQFITLLVTGGAGMRAAQTLARHSTAELTLGVYTKLRPDDERRALEVLPDLAPESSRESAEATGTDGPAINKASYKASKVGFDDTSGHLPTPPNPADDLVGAVAGVQSGGGGGNRTRVPESPVIERLRAYSAI
jgi:integrase